MHNIQNGSWCFELTFPAASHYEPPRTDWQHYVTEQLLMILVFIRKERVLKSYVSFFVCDLHTYIM